MFDRVMVCHALKSPSDILETIPNPQMTVFRKHHFMRDQPTILLDKLISGLDNALRTVFGPAPTTRDYPARDVIDEELAPAQQRLSGCLMRINHSGEICAQALYQGQALTATSAPVRKTMEHAAAEENDHLAWTAQRIGELGTHTSYLNPLWYAGSFAIGAVTGLAGDKWSLGFVAETERQVVGHLKEHLRRLPPSDAKSRSILDQMSIDEGRHATVALEAGAAELPGPVKQFMRATSKVMTGTAFWI